LSHISDVPLDLSSAPKVEAEPPVTQPRLAQQILKRLKQFR